MRRALIASIVLAGSVLVVAPAAAATPAGPGELSRFDLARKDCLGTAAGRTSKVWYTVAGGVLSDVYSPTIDNTNVQTMQFLVTDGATFTDLQSRDTDYTVRSLDATGMACEVTSTAHSGRYRLVTDYVTDPDRDAVVIRVRLVPLHGSGALKLYVRLDPSVNGNGGGGATNGGADDAGVDPATTALLASDPNTVTNATNRDYAVPTALALRADRPFPAATSGFAGTGSDGLAQLDADHRLTAHDTQALHGNVVDTAQLDVRSGYATLALGFGRDTGAAIGTAGAALRRPFTATYAKYRAGWRAYDAALRRPSGEASDAYWLSANVLKASEDKTYPGAVVASLASPWGQAVSAGDTPNGAPVYFGSYREVFSRDLYEAFTGLLADGDLATARDTVRFLFGRQQLADGRFPRNSLLNGRTAPDTGGDQLDESSYPILMAWQAGLAGDATLWPGIRRAADFVVAHGPSFGSERWEEQSGYSPSTIAAEIAGLVAAGAIADAHHDPAAARVYRSTADAFTRSIKDWTVTTTGPYGDGRYFIRLSKTGDPDAAVEYNLGNGSVSADQRAVVDAGFLELTRLGILPADDPDVLRSLPVVDQVIGRPQGVYRYGTASTGSEDGYGDCFTPDPTSCPVDGQPWPTANAGSGHLWPVLSGERAEQRLQVGDRAGARAELNRMIAGSSGVGLVPEQVWEDPNLPASPYGSDPATASIGFATGHAAGSASPLTWAQAQELRLILSLSSTADRPGDGSGSSGGRPVEQPSVVRDRYVAHRPPAALPLTVTAPGDGTSTGAGTVTVTGRTTPGAQVSVAASPTDVGTATTVVSATAGRHGDFSATVPVGFGTNVLTVAASLGGANGGATGYARISVVSTALPGTAVLSADDPSGDDHGPGSYTYPTAADFHDGAFDLQQFQVIDAGATVYLRAQLRDLTPTFGSPLGAQLLDVYVRDPSAPAFATGAPYPSRNYRIATDSAWSSRIEVQGFADPVFVDAAGHSLGTVAVSANQATRSILIAVPEAALGHPAAGWVFTVALHGQDGFSADQARGFSATPQPYLFGLCAPGGTSPVCGIDPASAPKVTDTVTPAGTDQAGELDPTAGTPTLHGVPVP
ncbi:glucodextranase DOMON-like domain-containing protein [Rugosimonospora africana]|nr:glucodextranase DOMON-like domain-containing protein [Rugosimonospora africana]